MKTKTWEVFLQKTQRNSWLTFYTVTYTSRDWLYLFSSVIVHVNRRTDRDHAFHGVRFDVALELCLVDWRKVLDVFYFTFYSVPSERSESIPMSTIPLTKESKLDRPYRVKYVRRPKNFYSYSFSLFYYLLFSLPTGPALSRNVTKRDDTTTTKGPWTL